MRFVFFIINSTLFIFYCILGYVIFDNNTLPTREINESQLYAQTLITIEFLDKTITPALWSFLFLIIMALIIGIYSRKPIDKLDRKIFFSKKGFLINTFLFVSLFIGFLNGSADWISDQKFANKEVEAIHALHKTEKTILLPFVSNETPESFSKRLNDSKGKDFNQLLEIGYRDECSNDRIDKVKVYSFSKFKFLIVSSDEIDDTIRLFKRSYEKDVSRCERIAWRKQKDLEESRRARLESDQHRKGLRDQADEICNIVNGTRYGC